MRVLLTSDMNFSAVARALAAEHPEWSVEEGSYNSWQLEPLNPNSTLYRTKPDLFVVALSPRALTDIPNLHAEIESVLTALSKTKPKTLFANMAVDPISAQPLFESLQRQRLAAQINERLMAFQQENLWFRVLDFSGFAWTHGWNTLTDCRFESVGRMFLNPRGADLFAKWLARNIEAVDRVPKKVLALDLDNTLWGGVLGEDGPEGILCGGEGAGYSFLRFQKELLRMKANGVLLAICSKNNEADVLDVFKNHPDFSLRLEDFAAVRANWKPKPENLKSLAEELNLGIDSFVFFDDSIHEREAVRQALPTVDVLEVPKEPADYIKTLSDYSGFDVFRVTAEDRERSKQYADETLRKTIKRQSGSLEDYYISLEMRASIAKASEKNLNRVHQLVHKTNQFNLTSERFDERQLRAMLTNPAFHIATLTLSDRLGESGLTGLVISEKQGGIWNIVNLLMSCRIIGRTVEFALMRFLAQQAVKNDCREIRARFVPSARNQVAADYLERAGFTKTGEHWTLRLPSELNKIPKDYVKVE